MVCMTTAGVMYLNSLGHTATIGPVIPIGPIGINCTYRANWADGTNWPNWHQFIGTHRTNWARGTIDSIGEGLETAHVSYTFVRRLERALREVANWLLIGL